MDLFQAIEKMRGLSEKNLSFSFSFMSYSADRGKSDGIVEVHKARLRKQSTVDDNRHADIMLNYFDLNANEYGRCYQPLLLEFEGQKLELN